MFEVIAWPHSPADHRLLAIRPGRTDLLVVPDTVAAQATALSGTGVCEPREVVRRPSRDATRSLSTYKNGRGGRSVGPETVNDYLRAVTRFEATARFFFFKQKTAYEMEL